tara:strand:+ start:6914 stop:7120 length:207 start_codon:yes stop_codon:yes gene_type:complete
MDGKVNYKGAAPGKTPPAVNKAIIGGQGSIPFSGSEKVATPKTSEGITTTGQKRGMGAALRGGRYTSE